MYQTREKFEYLKCDNCGCLQLVDVDKDFSQYYPKNYYSFESNTKKSVIKSYLRKKRDEYIVTGNSFVGFMLNKIMTNESLVCFKNKGIKKDSKILDIGCGSGKVLDSLDALGFKNLLGIDPYIKENFVTSSGVRILKCDAKDVVGKFDTIMLHHSMEHHPNQKEIVSDLKRLLEPDGVIIIRIPLCDSYAFEKYGKNWVQLDAPRHIFLHTKLSVKKLLEQFELEISEIKYDSTEFQFWGSEQYIQNIGLFEDESYLINKNTKLFTSMKIKEFQNMARNLNKELNGDQAIFYVGHKC